MASWPEPKVEITDLDEEKVLFFAVLTREQVLELCSAFEEPSRRWRGRYMAMAKGIVGAYEKWAGKPLPPPQDKA